MIGKRTFYPTDKMKEYIDDIMEAGRLSYGPYSQRFETEFAALHGCKYGVLSNSGTSSLLVALQTLKEVHNWQDGDEVIVPALTFVATVNVVLQAGLKPVLVDIEPDYYGINVNKISQVINNKTRCIIPVHTFGQPCDMDLLISYHQNATLPNGRFWNTDIRIVEDSCECVGVNYRGCQDCIDHSVGSESDIACFSFYMAHHITCGVGGMSITSNPEYARIMRSLVNHGLGFSNLPESEAFNTVRDFEFDRIGHSFRVTELEAALGLAQLETLKDTLAKRLMNAANLREGLEDLQDFIQLPVTRPHTGNSFIMFPLACKQEGIRDKLTQHLNDKDIGTRRMLPLVNQPCYKGLWQPDDYPIAQWIDRNGFYVGCHQDLTTKDLDYMIEAIREFFE